MTPQTQASPAPTRNRRIRVLLGFALGLLAATAALALSPSARQAVIGVAAEALPVTFVPDADATTVGLRVTTARAVTRVEERRFTGTVVARYETPVSFRVGGKVLLRGIEVGSAVQSGQVLMQLDPADLRAAVRAAEAALAAARSEETRAAAEESRYARLLGDGWVAQGAYDRALATLDAAREAVKAATARLSVAGNDLAYASLTADAAGIVTAIMAEAGQVVAAGQPVATLVRHGAVEAEVGIPEGQVDDLDGWSASASVWSAPDLWSAATLREIAPVADPIGRTHRARFSLTDAADLGATVTIRLRRESGTPLTPLPTTALAYRDDQPLVWIVTRDGAGVQPHPVTVESIGAEVVWLTGVPDGAAVVTLGVHRLDAGLTVRVVETVAPPTVAGSIE